MENWDNLSSILDKVKQDLDKKTFLNNLLIEESSKGLKENVKKILQAGANPNCAKGEYSPLIVALKGDFIDLSDYLFKIGALPGYKANENFVDAVWFAMLNKKYVPLRKFIRVNCPLNAHPITKKTLLGLSTDNSDINLVSLFLSHSRIKINERDSEGNTALHYNMSKSEMSQDDIDIGRMLLAAGAGTNIPNNEGKTPQQLGAIAGEALILESVLENEIPINPPFEGPNKKRNLKF